MSSQTAGAPATRGLGYLYALLRILFGLIGCLFIVGLRDLGTFWDPAGLMPLTDGGWKGFLVDAGWGPAAGRLLFVASLTSSVLMTVGFRSTFTIPVTFIVSSAHASWNPLPLSAAFEIYRAVLFCLIWADCGRVWSLDRWWTMR